MKMNHSTGYTIQENVQKRQYNCSERKTVEIFIAKKNILYLLHYNGTMLHKTFIEAVFLYVD